MFFLSSIIVLVKIYFFYLGKSYSVGGMKSSFVVQKERCKKTADLVSTFVPSAKHVDIWGLFQIHDFVHFPPFSIIRRFIRF